MKNKTVLCHVLSYVIFRLRQVDDLEWDLLFYIVTHGLEKSLFK